ncbi:MAG: carbon starvation protein A [Elusimicrobiota bacterium]|nr:carbon starvation protein A [Elusimicrobiota bacterium]
MNSLLIAIIVITVFFIAYRFYAKIIEKLLDVNPENKTPAITNYNGVDYVPVKHWTILFGHHFSSIAGAGPILGPVLAAATWGYLPALLWILLGTIFIGAVHDFSTLIVSLRHEGKSIANIASPLLGSHAKILFSLFVWLALILVVAVFAATTANTLVNEPRIVLPTFGLIFVAVLVGILIYRLNVNQTIATIIGVGLLAMLLASGYYLPIDLVKIFHIDSQLAFNIWIIILLLYSYIASIIPVNILLQPRDYLSAFILFFGLICGYLGLVLSHPTINTPAIISWNTPKGPLFPMLFVFIACGAVSGFHSLIASGTTSKQLDSERNAKKIGYGAMVLEGVLALLALLCVTAGLSWTIGGENPAGCFSHSYPELLKTGDWIGTFGCGYGHIVEKLIGFTFGCLIAITTLNAFVMTTLDTATRISRYITEELFGERLRVLKNRFLSTIVVVFFAGFLAFGNWKVIWPVFGASNQLVAAMALLIVSLWLLIKKKSSLYTLLPAVFMLIVTITALLYQLYGFALNKNYILTTISIFLILLSVILVFEATIKFIKEKTNSSKSNLKPPA